MGWKIALLVLVVAAFVYVTYMLIKSIKEFKAITQQITYKKDEEDSESEE